MRQASIRRFPAALVATAAALAALAAPAGHAQDNKVLNLYSARNYQTDEAL